VDNSVDKQQTNLSIPRLMGAAVKLTLFSPMKKLLIFQLVINDLWIPGVCDSLS
jgi:hypothetical protein|tara:strand:- start:419 stop:580 length:162 start_codon:yes stop_codon:yes gene_type:complete